jgi:L-iditol 2-dehydrogenase
LPEALRYARERVEDAIKVVLKTRRVASLGKAAAE